MNTHYIVKSGSTKVRLESYLGGNGRPDARPKNAHHFTTRDCAMEGVSAMRHFFRRDVVAPEIEVVAVSCDLADSGDVVFVTSQEVA